MPIVNTTPGTTFESSQKWFGGSKVTCYRQRVNATLGAPYVPLGFNVPAYARIKAVRIANVIVPTVTGTAATITADSIGLAMYPVTSPAVTAALTAPPATATVKANAQSITSNGVYSAGVLIAQTPGIGTSESNGVYRGEAIIKRVNTNAGPGAENPMPVAALLALVPTGLSSNVSQVNGTAITSGYVFGTGSATGTSVVATVDVTLYVETFDDYPSF